jgi:hypothetical protein
MSGESGGFSVNYSSRDAAEARSKDGERALLVLNDLKDTDQTLDAPNVR